MPSKYVEVDGYAVNYFHTGRTTLPDVTPDVSKGQLLLYLHGAGGNGHFAHKMLDLLSADHSPLALDYPGHGRSRVQRLYLRLLEKAGGASGRADRPLDGRRYRYGPRPAAPGDGWWPGPHLHGGQIRYPRRAGQCLETGDAGPHGAAVYQGFLLAGDADVRRPGRLDGANQDRPAGALLRPGRLSAGRSHLQARRDSQSDAGAGRAGRHHHARGTERVIT